jgi:hypothetical protein
MKNLLVFATVFFGLSFLGCQDTKEESVNQPDMSFHKSIGTQISLETGMRWIDAYNSKYQVQGRTETSPYSISSSQLSSLTSSVPISIGMAFHHAIDDDGQHHFIVIPVDLTLSLWNPLFSRNYVDANTNTVISRTDARRWAQNYEDANPNGIWFHFFGGLILGEISLIPHFTNLQIVPAINDQDLSPQLLLIVEDESVNSAGRYRKESTTVYDMSSPCPPCPIR